MLNFLIENYQIVSVVMNVTIVLVVESFVKWIIGWKNEHDERERERQQMEKSNYMGINQYITTDELMVILLGITLMIFVFVGNTEFGTSIASDFIVCMIRSFVAKHRREK